MASTLLLFDLAEGVQVGSEGNLEGYGGISKLAFSRDGGYLLVGRRQYERFSLRSSQQVRISLVLPGV
jgi:hypothetical protein